MAYDPNHEYRFTDKDGNTFTSKGDNGYVWQAVTEGIPISVDQNGNWYTEPYLDVEQTGYVAHIPNWFKATKEYENWQNYASQIPNLSVNKTVYENLNGILKTLGAQGALRTSLTQDIKSYDSKGILNQKQIDKYVEDIVKMAAEGQGGNKANLKIWGTEYDSAADFARHYKELSKESLSKAMTSMYGIMEKGQKGEWEDDPQHLLDAVTSAKILNYIDDNHISYGDDDEFNGLLSSSVLQQINRGLTQFMGGISSNTFVGIPARLAYATLNAQYGDGEFSMRIEDLYNKRLATGSDLGAGLEGNETADVVGMWGGAIGSIAVTMATSMMMGSAINGKVATSAPGGFLEKVGTFAQTIPGSAVTDFFLNDIPLDLMIFGTDTMRDGIDKAWFDPENPQPLFGIPFVRQGSDGNFYPSGVGPDVPGGLAMNLAGDAILDAAIPFLSIVGNATYKGLDNMTGGAVTRLREKASLLNLQIQQKITDTPIVGTAWQKFVNYMMGAENAQFIREARKAAIAEGSMEPYVRAQNLLTLSNHSGMEVVQPLYKQLDSELEISKTLKDFSKQANTYGGVGETRVEWKEIEGARTKDFYKAVPDTVPRQVKQGLLDVERLSELNGEIQNEGGLIPDPVRKKEIAEIEARLEKTPQAIKDFAEKFSQLNKRVEAMRVDLGITTQDWIDAFQADPRWESYMTRQALTIGGQTVSSGINPPDAKIITAKRKGYYSENYIDPTLALGMKVEALGRAFAWNERAKAMVGFEISQGKVIAGKGGVDIARRLSEVKEQIKHGTEFRKSIGYDEQLGAINVDVNTINNAFRNINDLMNLPERLTLKSVYEATQNPRIKSLVSNFNNGTIKFADGVKEAVGLSDADAAAIIQNTYSYNDKISIGGKKSNSPKSGEAPLSQRVGSTNADSLPIYTPMYRGQGTGRDDFYFNDVEQRTDLLGDGYFLSTDRGVSTAFEGSGGKGGGIISPLIPSNKVASEEEIRALVKKAQDTISNPKKYAELEKTNPGLAERYDQIAAWHYEDIAKELNKPVLPYLDAAGGDERLYYKGIDSRLDAELKNQLVSSEKYYYQEGLYEQEMFSDPGHYNWTPKQLFEDNQKWQKLPYEERMRLLDDLDDRMVDDGGLALEMLDDAYATYANQLNYEAFGAGGTVTNIPDNADPTKTTPENRKGKDITAGVTNDGRAFEYTLDPKTNTITEFKEITDPEGMADTINKLGGIYHVSAETISKIGDDNARAINRTILYYRDNMPTLPIGPTYKMARGDNGTLGWMYPLGGPGYNLHIENGHIVADQFEVFLATDYFEKGNEAFRDRTQTNMANQGWSPKNSARPENTAIHETGHITMARLALLEMNRKIDEGILKIPDDISQQELNRMALDQWRETHKLLAQKAIESMGLKFSDTEWQRQALTISGYAGSMGYDAFGFPRHVYRAETFSEAMVDYWANGANASKFTLAIVEQMKQMSERFSVAASPEAVFKGNNLVSPKGLFKDEQYNFPKRVKTDKQKAKWLDEWRQKNPFTKGKGLLSETDYQKANLWDTFFQKEIRAYDANAKTAMPDALVKKNGDFIENLSKNAAKKMVEEIKSASIEGFDRDLATMILSRNSNDVQKALDEFIIGRIDKAAEEIAAKMSGGKTEDNLNTARITLWSDSSVRNDMVRMVQTLSPDIDNGNIQSKITKLFDTQAKGLASFEALPVETKQLYAQQKELSQRLYKENNYAKKAGKKADEALSDYRGEVTQVVHYKEGGEDVYVVVNDPVIADVLKKPANYKETGVTVEAIASAANFISRAYRLGTTGANPIAFVRNVLRDPIQATIQGGFNPLNMSLSPEVFYRTLRGFGLDDATIENVTQRLKTWSSSGTLTSEMRNMGISTPTSLGYRNRVEKISKKVRNSDGKLAKIIEKGEAPLETWESMFRNQIAQQSFIKNYQKTKDVNRAMGSALFDASNSTTNFSHSVGLFSRATSTVPYLSSAINGTRSFWVQFNADPIGMITRITAGFMVPAMAITAWNLSSQERRDTYMNLPEWYKDGHLILIDLEGNVISFPIPEELGQYYGTSRKLIEFTQEATPYGLGQIMSQGVFGFLPVDIDGFYGEDGSVQVGRGAAQLISGILPQAATAIYEFAAEKDLFTGQDLSDYNAFQKWINAGANIFGTGFKNIVNDIGFLVGAPKEFRLGKTTAETLARDLFGVGFDTAKTQFMALVGSPSEVDPETGKETEATGLFAENERLQKQIEGINAKIAFSSDDKKAELEKQKEELISNFTDRVSNLVNKYMNLYTQTGGLEEWQKEKIVKILTLGRASSSASSEMYQSADISTAYLDERALAQQRYVGAGLPAGPSLEALGDNGSIELQAAVNRFYGVNKQATQDFKNMVEESGMKKVRDEFYSVMQQIYDAADEQGKQPDYDLIERIQARYLQMMDAILIPIINQYGVNTLNNNDFIDAVRRQVNGMIPSDDWRQSVRNAKKFLSTKDFPTATVDVKKWLKKRYTSGMRNRNLASDPEVAERIESIREDIDAGRTGAAAGKIKDLKTGINKANFYISSEDLMVLNQLNNMVK